MHVQTEPSVFTSLCRSGQPSRCFQCQIHHFNTKFIIINIKFISRVPITCDPTQPLPDPSKILCFPGQVIFHQKSIILQRRIDTKFIICA